VLIVALGGFRARRGVSNAEEAVAAG
jgi:hypothetical protein